MPARVVRVLHAADLLLDRPLQGLGSLSEDLTQIVDASTLTAWERLTTLAIERQVDAVLLTGNTFDAAQASLTAEVALRAGLNRLAEQGIPVLVVPGKHDPLEAWRDLPAMPDNLIVFEDDQDEPIELDDDHGKRLVTFFPVSAETTVDPPELDRMEDGQAPSQEVSSWNVGLLIPDHRRATNDSVSRLLGKFASLHYLACSIHASDEELPLTEGHIQRQKGAQGLETTETGLRGATLVELEPNGRVRTQLVPLAAVRFERLPLATAGLHTQEELLERVLSIVEHLPDQSGELLRVITWHLDQPLVAGWNVAEEEDAEFFLDALQSLTDQPKQLRWWHRVTCTIPFEDLQDVPHPDLWHEFRRSLHERTPVTTGHLGQLLHDAEIRDGALRTRFDRTMDQMDLSQIAETARRQGWRWLVGSGGTSSR